MIHQSIIPVISDMKALQKFLKHQEEWCVLMDFHINLVEDVLETLHAHQKKALVHMDLIKGIQNDKFGVQFLCQKYHADGIISTKPGPIEYAKKNHCVSVLRVFLIDSRSLEKGSMLAQELQPDYVEVLPAIVPFAVEAMQRHCSVPVIGGGLIRNAQDIRQCKEQGMVAVTTSNLKLCEEVLK